MDDLDDIGPVVAHPFVMFVAFVLLGTGLTVVVASLQVLVAVRVIGWLKLLPPLLGLLGLPLMAVGGVVGRGQLWASLLCTGLAWLVALLELVWVGYAVLGGFLAPLQLLALLSALLSGVLAPLTILPNTRVTAARAKLFAD